MANGERDRNCARNWHAPCEVVSWKWTDLALNVGWLIAKDYEEFCIASGSTWARAAPPVCPGARQLWLDQYCRPRCPNHSAGPRRVEQLRAQLQVLHDEWRDKALSFKEETRTRLEELKGELSPKYREILDEARQHALDAAAARKPRRGGE